MVFFSPRPLAASSSTTLSGLRVAQAIEFAGVDAHALLLVAVPLLPRIVLPKLWPSTATTCWMGRLSAKTMALPAQRQSEPYQLRQPAESTASQKSQIERQDTPEKHAEHAQDKKLLPAGRCAGIPKRIMFGTDHAPET